MAQETVDAAGGTADRYDVVVVGGGAAGLSGGIALARSRRSVLVVDGGQPRNAPADGVHNLLGREGVSPAELLRAGRAELAGYGGALVEGQVVHAERDPDGLFTARLADGRRVRARRLLLATGLVDELPDVAGLRERWGTDVLHCPYCHGWEVRDQPLGVLATTPLALHQAHLFRRLSDDVVVFAHTADLSPEHRHELEACGVRVVEGTVTGVEVDAEGLSGVRLAGGQLVARRVLVVAPRFVARTVPGLGLDTQDLVVGGHVVGSHLVTGPAGTTSVPGVWVAGNATDLQAQVSASAAAGLLAGAHVNADLVQEEVRRAVAAA